MTLYPNDYTPVRAGGRNGDMKNDGYCSATRVFFQAHATRGESAAKTKEKIKTDLEGCLQKWNDIEKFVYITNDTLIGEVENFVDSLRKLYPKLIIETWGYQKLTSKIIKLSVEQIEYVIDRKLIPEISIIESEVFSAKYLITNEYRFIKEIAQSDLSNFPFENPILYENETLKFLRDVTFGQDYRDNEIENSISIKEGEYLEKYPDAIEIPKNDEEYRFLYHQRVPNKDEIKSVLKGDKISQFLSNNNIQENRISKINTCYAGECYGNGMFQELYLLRPLYAQFLVLKNISDRPIKLQSLDSVFMDGILYNQIKTEINYTIKLPEFIVEPNQNVIFPTSLFLSEFRVIEELKSDTVTSIYVPDQIQKLEFGSLNSNNKIEYIGPSFHPKSINSIVQKKSIKSDIHKFSFDNIYWLNRHWQCGSCPHIFFNQKNELKYQGEIFNVEPNKVCIENIIIPNNTSELIIAELEQEKTLLLQVIKNGNIIGSNIQLEESEYYTIAVEPMDVIKIKGMYQLKGNYHKTMPIAQKIELVGKFKKNYAQQRTELKNKSYLA